VSDDGSSRWIVRGLVASFVVGIAAAAVWAWGALMGPRASGPSDPWFVDRAASAGIAFRTAFLPTEQGENFKVNLYDHGSGVAVADVDGDGLDDLYFCNQLRPNALYRNLGDGRFEDVTARAGVALADRICVSAVFGDVDGDGRPDLFVTSTMGGNALFRNDGAWRFTDVTAKAGVGGAFHSQSATFFDADGDGDLDLLVSNTARWTTDATDPTGRYRTGGGNLWDLVAAPHEENRFYVNRGDGTFDESAKAAGLAGVGWSGDTAVFDCDEDGDLDVLMVNMFGASRLLQNDGRGKFTDVTKAVLGRPSWGAVGVKAFDYDDDGRLDLFLVDMHSDMWMGVDYVPNREQAATRFDGPNGPYAANQVPPKVLEAIARLDVRPDEVVFGNTLFHALGGGRFEEVSAKAGVETLWPWGVAAADFDGDGFEDVLIPSGMGYPYRFLPDAVLRNLGDGTFAVRTYDAGLDPPPGGALSPGTMAGRTISRSSRAAAVGDFDGDGRPDVVVSNFNDAPFLLMNRTPRRSWVGLRLVGTHGNTAAIGAVVRLKVGGKTLTRQVHAAGGYLAQSTNELLFGLGDATSATGEVVWPGGRRQPIAIDRVDRVIRLEEPP
jgi:hypothetical protein